MPTRVISQLNIYEEYQTDGDPDSHFGYCKLKGRRREQEDALARDILDSQLLAQLSPEEIGKRLWTVYKKIDNTLTSREEIGGSTASTVVYDGKSNVICATVGDSSSFVCIYDKLGVILKVVRINSIIHDPNQPSEKTRIEELGGMILHNRINNLLGMSRAIGDHELSHKGKKLPASDAQIDILDLEVIINNILANNPSLTRDSIGKIQIISTCDGFTDAAGVLTQSQSHHENYLFKCLLEIPSIYREDTQAELLGTQAIADKSEDNVTVGIQTIIPGVAVIMGVFDGHGSHAIAHLLAQSVIDAFEYQCKLSADDYSQQPSSTANSNFCYEVDNVYREEADKNNLLRVLRSQALCLGYKETLIAMEKAAAEALPDDNTEVRAADTDTSNTFDTKSHLEAINNLLSILEAKTTSPFEKINGFKKLFHQNNLFQAPSSEKFYNEIMEVHSVATRSEAYVAHLVRYMSARRLQEAPPQPVNSFEY